MNMKRRMRKRLFLAFVAALLVFLTACGSSGGRGGGSSSPAGDADAGTEGSASGESGLGREPITLTFAAMGDVSSTPGIQNNDVMTEIERLFNIKLDWLSLTFDQLDVRLAAGDLPDILFIEPSKLGQYINHLIPLDDLVEKYGPDIKRNVPHALEYSRKYYSNNTGNLYMLTTSVPIGDTLTPPVYNYSIGPTIRWDYYKEMGYPKIENEDEYLNVLAEMLKAHPKTPDGNRMYGISCWTDWGLWCVTVPYFLSYYGTLVAGLATIEFDPQLTIARSMYSEDGGYWKSTKFLFKAYQLGLVDPEMFTQRHADWQNKLNNLQLLTQPYLDNSTVSIAAEERGIEYGGYMILPGASEHVYAGNIERFGGAIRALVISKNNKHPERTMEFLNYLYSFDGTRLIQSGVEGKHWTRVDGKPEFTEETLQRRMNDPNFRDATGIGKYVELSGLAGYVIHPEDGQYLALSLTDQAIAQQLNNLSEDFNAHYGVEYPAQAFLRLQEQGKTSIDYYDLSFLGLLPQAPEEIRQIDTKIESYMTTMSPRLILAKDEEEFEKIKQEAMQELAALGHDKSAEFWVKAYYEAYEQVKSLK